MAETYSIQATLTAKDELSPVLDQIAKNVAKLQDLFHDLAGSKIFDAIVNDANKAINAFGRVKSAADKLGTSLGSLGGAKSGRHFWGPVDSVSSVIRAFEQVGRIASETGGKAGGLAPVATAIQEIATAAHKAAEEQKALNEALGSTPKPGTEAGKPDPRAELAEARAERAEKFNQKGEALKGFGEQLKGFGESLQSGLERINDAGAEFQAVMATFRGLGLVDKTNAEAEKFVTETKLTGVTSTALLQKLIDSYQATNSFEQAEKVAPFLARMEFSNEALYKGKYDDAQSQAETTLVDSRGGFGREGGVKEQVDYMQNVLLNTAAHVLPKDMLDFVNQGGAAAKLMKDETLYYQMAPIISAMPNAKEAGSGLAAVYDALALGHASGGSAEELAGLGLVDSDSVEKDAKGHINGIKPGGVQGGDLAAADPLQFLRTVLLPAFEKHGITSHDDIVKKFSVILKDQNAAKFYTTLYEQQSAIDESVRKGKSRKGLDEAEELAKNTPTGSMMALKASWDGFLESLSAPLAGKDGKIGAVAKAMNILAYVLDGLSSFAKEYQPLVTFLIATATGLAVFAAVMGTILVVIGSVAVFIGAFLMALSVFGGAVLGGIALFAAAVALAVAALFVDWGWVWQGIQSGAAWLEKQLIDWWNGLGNGMKAALISFAIIFSEAVWPIVAIGAAIFLLIHVLAHWHETMQLLTDIWNVSTAAVDRFCKTLQDGFVNLLSTLMKSLALQFGIPTEAVDVVMGTGKKAASSATTDAMRTIADNAALPLGMGWEMRAEANIMDWWNGGSGPTIQGGPAPAMTPGGGGPTMARAAAMSDAATAQSGAPIQVHPGQVVVNLDDRTIATAVMEFMARQPGGPNIGSVAHDPQAGYTTPGYLSGQGN
jgi:hypothetical protein